MKTCRAFLPVRWCSVFTAFCLFFVTAPAPAAGTWAALTHRTPNITPNGNPSLMLLLSDGTVMVENEATGNGGTNWFRLTPDIHGSYADGTWTQLASMHYGRAGCASDIMTNGNVFFAGGEYGTGDPNSEFYNPVSNLWTIIPVPTNLINPTQLSPIWGGGTTQCFGDCISVMLSNGNVLMAPVAVEYAKETMIYNPVSNLFTAGPNLFSSSQSEASWVKLPDNSILTIDPSSTSTERYIPSLNKWVKDATVPAIVYSTNNGAVGTAAGELGPGFLLPNGKAMFFGSTINNVIYTPSGNANPGTWTVAATYPTISTNAQGMPDAPGCMMVNGKVLLATGTADTFNGPISFLEYDYTVNTFTQVSAPSSAATNAAPYYTKFLQLPDGTVLFNFGTPQLYCYTPDGTPLAEGKPTIHSVLQNTDGSFTLSGYGLNGISAGAAYGDDAQMDSNYPIVRMTNSIGTVYYGRTYGWTSTSVMATNTLVSTQFVPPTNFPAGTYSLVVVANGNASAAVPFTVPLTSPAIANASLSSGNLVLNCANGLAGRTYYTLTSTSPTAPINQWTAVATNVLATNGNFTIGATNIVNFGEAQRYFMLQAQ
jgi:hypothetical protein